MHQQDMIEEIERQKIIDQCVNLIHEYVFRVHKRLPQEKEMHYFMNQVYRRHALEKRKSTSTNECQISRKENP